ncbi:DUF3037 domain-containing protein [Mucilaginibacter sp.]|uniref:DUF3037 domain-containing protein n=1 Tax=Mucilaginibacter sp. TaxID=1882438 RepID=UPI003B00D68B
MQHVFEYAVIRVMPKVEREEFINVGVILYCSKQKFLQVLFNLDEIKLHTFSAGLDIPELQEHLKSFERICMAAQHSDAIGKLDQASRFRWLTATRSTVLQTSKVHPGLCVNADETLSKLFQELVL